MINFAHTGHEHAKNIDAATHHIPVIIGLSLLVAAVLATAYWLMTHNAETKAQDDQDK